MIFSVLFVNLIGMERHKQRLNDGREFLRATIGELQERFRQHAWNPTLVIFLIVSGWFYANVLFCILYRPVPWAILVPIFIIQTVLVFCMFTPLHESVHRVASPNRVLNDLIMWGTWPVFLNNPYFFKVIHIIHHAYTNVDGKDPDHWTSGKTWPMRWLQSFTLIFYYYWFGLKNIGSGGVWRLVTLFSSFVGPSIMLGLGLFTNYWEAALVAWIAPVYVGIGFLAFFNTSLPHYPGTDASPFYNTRMLVLPRWLEFLMFDQNYHLVHHLRPTIPWYQYRNYWKKNRERLIERKVPIVSYTGDQI